MRVGFGTDLHRLSDGAEIILGGVKIPAPFTVVAHSDGDVLLHALTDAILGALAQGDIGEMFPDTAPENAKRDSADFVAAAVNLMQQKNYGIGNVDAIINLQQPKLSAYKNRLRENLAKLLHTGIDNINIKAKTGENLGDIGNSRAISAEVIVLLKTKMTTFNELYPFSSQYFTHRDHHRQHYLDLGAGEVLLMLHGNPTWSFFYRDLIKHFSPTHRVLAPDHLGMGFSDKPQNYSYTLSTHLENLTQLLASILPDEKVTLIVHDWGGAIGMGWAIKNIDRLKRIIVFNSAAFSLSSIPLRINICRVPLLGDLLIRGFNAFASGATFMATVKPLSTAVKNGFILPYSSWKNRLATLRFVQDIPLNSRHPSYALLKHIEENLPRLSHLPFLLQWGARDWCFHDLFYQRWLHYFPHAQTDYYHHAGHYLLEDAGETICARLEKFIHES